MIQTKLALRKGILFVGCWGEGVLGAVSLETGAGGRLCACVGVCISEEPGSI